MVLGHRPFVSPYPFRLIFVVFRIFLMPLWLLVHCTVPADNSGCTSSPAPPAWPVPSSTTASKSSLMPWSRSRKRSSRIPSTVSSGVCPVVVRSAYRHKEAIDTTETHYELLWWNSRKLEWLVISIFYLDFWCGFEYIPRRVYHSGYHLPFLDNFLLNELHNIYQKRFCFLSLAALLHNQSLKKQTGKCFRLGPRVISGNQSFCDSVKDTT